MLISFSVRNYRSFADSQTLSMSAGVGARRKENISFASENSLAPSLLRSACLFGSNGAGKSNFVEAINFFREFVVSSAKDNQEGEKIDTTPFKFDRTRREQPSEFEASFVTDGNLYQYGFAVDENRVWGEWLFSRPNELDTRSRTLFQREYDSESGIYHWHVSKKHVKGEKELWKKSTRDNALFISTAIQLKSAAFKHIFDWIQRNLRIIKSPDRLSPSFTIHQIQNYGKKESVIQFLQAVDIGIKSVEIEEKAFTLRDAEEIFSKNILPRKLRDSMRKSLERGTVYKTNFYHQGTDGELVGLDIHEESDGSQVLFSLASSWLDVLENGYTLIVDELHNSLHPLALRFLVGLFHGSRYNTGNAQLIFTSHETSVMTKGFMHQDQVWFLEKGDMGNSLLFPLSDYKVRDVSAFQKAYLDGRYGAIPRISDFVEG